MGGEAISVRSGSDLPHCTLSQRVAVRSPATERLGYEDSSDSAARKSGKVEIIS